MDLYDLLSRPSLRGLPISVIVRPNGPYDAIAVARQVVDLLAGLDPASEILLLSPNHPALLPARIRGLRVRVVVHPDVSSGECFSQAIAAARNEILLWMDERVSLRHDELATILDHLEYADVVIGRRAGRSSRVRRLLEWPIRAILGIPQADPFSPVKAMRKSAVRELVLESRGDTVDLELLAKANYMVSLIDEVEIAEPMVALGITRAAFGSTESRRAWLRPVLWRSSLLGEPANRELSNALVAAPCPSSHSHTMFVHSPSRHGTGWRRADRLPRRCTNVLRPK